MYRVTVHDYFSSAHQLNGYAGKCEDLHGHNWKVVVDVEGEKLDKIGLLIDFKIVKRILKEILDELDHKFLNDIEDLKGINPSSENLSHYVFDRMKKELPDKVKLTGVTIWESENSRATYFE